MDPNLLKEIKFVEFDGKFTLSYGMKNGEEGAVQITKPMAALVFHGRKLGGSLYMGSGDYWKVEYPDED